MKRNSYNNFNPCGVINQDATGMMAIKNAYKILGGMTEIKFTAWKA
jgi:hypothetical protein